MNTTWTRIIALVSIAAWAQAFGQGEPYPPERVLREDGVWVGLDEDPETVLQGTFGNPMGQAACGPGISQMGGGFLGGTVFVYQIPFVHGSPWAEDFLVGIPNNPMLPAPVLVLFHAYGEDLKELQANTNLINEAMHKGWVVIAPLGAHVYNYGIDYSQRNVEAAILESVARIIPSFNITVDADRFYAVGFSMGGGAAASFAARHIDSSGLRFAAVANHTGSASLTHSYWSTPANPVNKFKEFLANALMFGGPPTIAPYRFRYLQSSSVDADYFASNAVDQATDMVRNLRVSPMMSFYDDTDPNTHLIDQTKTAHHQLLANRNGSGPLIHKCRIGHKWRSLDSKEVLRFLETKSYPALPRKEWVSVLVDRDARWYEFDVVQAKPTAGWASKTPGAFSSFKWFANSGSNGLGTAMLNNISQIKLAFPSRLKLRLSATPRKPEFNWWIQTTQLEPVSAVIGEVRNTPTSVTRGTVPGSYSYNPVNQELTLFEPGSVVGVTWTIVP